MSRISATTELLPGKAMYRPQDATAKPAQPPAAAPAKTPASPPAKPSEQLQSMLNTRQRASGNSLKAMIADADAELARQDDMIQDVDRILIMDKAAKAYGDAAKL